MTTPGGTSDERGRVRRAARWAPASILLAAAATSLWIGCSVERDYALLSFFFDGVPDPGALGEPAFPGGPRIPGTVSIKHPPFAEGACLECHPSPSRFTISRDDSSICVRCHEDVRTAVPLIHAPVQTVDCLWCHDPHQSGIQGLLRAPGPELCGQCHDLVVTGRPPTPDHADPARDCLECHRGHGGDDPYFLRLPLPTPPEEATTGDLPGAEG